MRILIDIGHPAHVHYFRNAMKELEEKGHELLITTRDKEVTLSLLDSYGFRYVCTGKNKKGVVNKFFTMIRNDVAIYRAAKRFKPDIFFSFFTPFAAHVGALTRKPVIGFTDTEFAKLSIRLTLPFTDYVFTPECFSTDFGKKQYRFKGYMEYFYLHPAYFTPDKSVLKELSLEEDEPYYLMRFVSFSAGHDTSESGIDKKSKELLVDYLSSRHRLFISSEDKLTNNFDKFRMRIEPHKFHDLLAFSHLYVGEGITTASESALLGVPAVLINTLTTSYINEHEKNGLLYRYPSAEGAIDKIKELTKTDTIKAEFQERSRRVKDELIDCTKFLVWLLDSYPESIAQLNRDPSLQYSFQ